MDDVSQWPTQWLSQLLSQLQTRLLSRLLTQLQHAPNSLLLLVLAIAFTTGCATRPLPGRNWQSPIDLRLSSNSLKEMKVTVACGDLSDGKPTKYQTSKFCTAIESRLKELGATIASDTSDTEIAIGQEAIEPIDLRLEYLVGEQQSDGCGLYALATFLSSGLFPCASLQETPIEVRVLDSRGVAVEEHHFWVKQRRIYGSTALLLLVDGRAREEQHESRERLITFLTNRVYTASLRTSVHEKKL